MSTIFTAGSEPSNTRPRSTTTSNRTVANKPAPVKPEVIETRSSYPIGSIIEAKHIRKSPSASAAVDGTGDLFASERIFVLEKRGDWIRFRVTPKDQGWSAWMPANLTISDKELLAQREAKFGKKPLQSSYKKSVRAVQNYIKEVAKDPSSVEFEEWSKVYYNENDGWVVYCKYRGKNSFGGYSLEANWFVIRNGVVVDVKPADEYVF